MNREEIIEASRIGTTKAIGQIIFIWALCVLILGGLIFSVGGLIDNHREYKRCIEIREDSFYSQPEDYTCIYFGEKNHWEVWEEARNRFDSDDPTITIYARDKFEEDKAEEETWNFPGDFKKVACPEIMNSSLCFTLKNESIVDGIFAWDRMPFIGETATATFNYVPYSFFNEEK